MHFATFYQSSMIWLLLLFSYGCEKNSNQSAAEESGYVKGTVTDTQGNPLAGVKIIVDNTILYNTNIRTSTDNRGNYKVKLSTGAWVVYAQHTVPYNGRTYTLYLDPDNEDGFGIEGGTRNFRWKLTGVKKGSLAGTYGGTILLTRGVGSTLFDSRNIEYTLTPVGNLIDGSTGQVLKLREDPNYPKLADVPIGRYRITAVYKSSSGDVPVKLMNHYDQSGGFVSSLTIDFQPMSPDGENMASIEYHE